MLSSFSTRTPSCNTRFEHGINYKRLQVPQVLQSQTFQLCAEIFNVEFLESSNLLPLGVVKSLQTIISRGFKCELQDLVQAHAACVHFHTMDNELQKLISQEWALDDYQELTDMLSDITTDELRERISPCTTEYMSRTSAGIILCNSIIVRHPLTQQRISIWYNNYTVYSSTGSKYANSSHGRNRQASAGTRACRNI